MGAMAMYSATEMSRNGFSRARSPDFFGQAR
jgi:hypothetical protein